MELSDASVWEVTLGFTTGWFAGDRVVVDSTTIVNLDEAEEVQVSFLGTAIAHPRIDDVLNSGQFVALNDGTLWEIDVLDRLHVNLWLSVQRVVVVRQSQFNYHLVRESDGRVVGATPIE